MDIQTPNHSPTPFASTTSLVHIQPSRPEHMLWIPAVAGLRHTVHPIVAGPGSSLFPIVSCTDTWVAISSRGLTLRDHSYWSLSLLQVELKSAQSGLSTFWHHGHRSPPTRGLSPIAGSQTCTYTHAYIKQRVTHSEKELAVEFNQTGQTGMIRHRKRPDKPVHSQVLASKPLTHS